MTEQQQQQTPALATKPDSPAVVSARTGPTPPHSRRQSLTGAAAAAAAGGLPPLAGVDAGSAAPAAAAAAAALMMSGGAPGISQLAASGLTAARIAEAAQSGQRIFENTYRTAPERKFPTEAARQLGVASLARHLGAPAFSYTDERAAAASKAVAADILAGLRAFELERFKFVVDVTVGEFRGQGMRVCSRGLWDPATDTYTSASYKNASVFAVAMIFGVYYE